ncbi:MAG: adenylate/guanylate cyclase domain-containing protein [Gammaproteobacteria bacterium]|nr:adenylate/guanylate cyclase domain-containing protein [Gammaproteobacteria bacterium]
MNSLIQNAVSFFEKSIAVSQPFATSSRGDAIVSGYSFASNVNRHEPLPESCDRRRAGIFYADIANYSPLTEQDEEGAHRRLAEGMKIMKAYITASNGRVAHTAGDAILAEFKDADNALQCAVNVQLAARVLNARLHVSQRLLFRIGVNFGEVIADNADIYGNALNLAARLEKLADSEGICVSDSVRSELEDNSAFNFVALGKQYVKNINEPVQAFWIEIDAQQVVDADFTGTVKVSVMAS